MATEKPKHAPAGINKFKAALAQVASVPKELVDARVAEVAKRRKKRRGKR